MITTIVVLALRVAVLVGLAAVVLLFRQRAAAAERHFIWMLAVGASLMLPIATVALPALRVLPASHRIERASVAAVRDAGIETPAAVAPTRGVNADRSDVVLEASTTPRDPARILVGWWMLGAIVSVARLVLAHRRARWVVRLATRQPHLSSTDGTPVFFSEAASLSFAYGVRRPVIVLPAAASAWSASLLRATLLHEEAHVQRGDGVALLMSQLALSVFWWHPAVWFANWRACIERERACDDAVLRAGVSSSEYGTHLLSHATVIDSWGTRPIATALFLHSEGLAARIESLLDPRVRRSAFGRRASIVAGLAALLVTGVVGAAMPAEVSIPTQVVNPRPAPPTRKVVSATPTLPTPPVVRERPTRPTRAVVGPCQQSDAKFARRYADSLIQITGAGASFEGNSTKYIWTGVDCIAWIRVTGAIGVAADEADITVVGTGARFVAHDERDGAGIREYVVSADARTIRVDGRTAPVAPEDREWIGGMVREYIRRAGLRPASRAATILDAGGTAALLAEVKRIPRTDTRADYLIVAFARTIDASARVRFIRDGAELLDSGMDRAMFLLAVPAAWRADEATLAAIYEEAALVDPDAGVEAIFRRMPPPMPLSVALRPAVERLIATLQNSETRGELPRSIPQRTAVRIVSAA